MYVVLGASGNTGSVVASRLLEAGKKVRALARDEHKMAPVIKLGAEPRRVDILDTEALAEACVGAEALYVLIPPNVKTENLAEYEGRIIEAIAGAIENAGVTHAVVLSSIGADKPERTGPVLGLRRLEERLTGIEWLNAVFLRAGYFMENLLPQVKVIHDFGMMAGPLRADLPLPMIAAKDIGAAAAERLLRLDFKGKETHELLGERDITFEEATRVLVAAIKRPLRYMQLPKQQLIETLGALGFSTSMARALLEMNDALNDGYMRALEARSARNTTPTSIEAWAEEVFAPAFQGRAAGAVR